MSNEYKDWMNDEIADLNYCLKHMYDTLTSVFNKLYDEDRYNDYLKSVSNVLGAVDEIYLGNQENVACLDNLVKQEYHALKKCLPILDNPLHDVTNELLTSVEYLRGDSL